MRSEILSTRSISKKTVMLSILLSSFFEAYADFRTINTIQHEVRGNMYTCHVPSEQHSSDKYLKISRTEEMQQYFAMQIENNLSDFLRAGYDHNYISKYFCDSALDSFTFQIK